MDGAFLAAELPNDLEVVVGVGMTRCRWILSMHVVAMSRVVPRWRWWWSGRDLFSTRSLACCRWKGGVDEACESHGPLVPAGVGWLVLQELASDEQCVGW